MNSHFDIHNILETSTICDPFCENVPKVAKTSFEIWLKVKKN